MIDLLNKAHDFIINLLILLVPCAQKPRLRRLSARSKQDSFLKDMMCVRYIIIT